MTKNEFQSRNFDEWSASTERFYEENADEYFEKTVRANLSHLYERFLPLVPKGGRILDAGCGSGRDLRYFKDRGYRPFGIDSSPNLIRLARLYASVECEVRRLQDIPYIADFDAVWACASLLHLEKGELPEVLGRIKHALVADGILFATVQLGQGEGLVPDGRFYAYYDPQEFLGAIRAAGLTIEDSWITEDSLPNRPSVRWVNVLAQA